MDGSFHSPEWHAARLASLQTSHTVTWEEWKQKQKVCLSRPFDMISFGRLFMVLSREILCCGYSNALHAIHDRLSFMMCHIVSKEYLVKFFAFSCNHVDDMCILTSCCFGHMS